MNEETENKNGLLDENCIACIKYTYTDGTELIIPTSFIASEEIAKVIYSKSASTPEFNGKILQSCLIFEVKNGEIGELIANYKSN
jgi:hypothetical protein